MFPPTYRSSIVPFRPRPDLFAFKSSFPENPAAMHPKLLEDYPQEESSSILKLQASPAIPNTPSQKKVRAPMLFPLSNSVSFPSTQPTSLPRHRLPKKKTPTRCHPNPKAVQNSFITPRLSLGKTIRNNPHIVLTPSSLSASSADPITLTIAFPSPWTCTLRCASEPL